jgi:hypothetical protein
MKNLTVDAEEKPEEEKKDEEAEKKEEEPKEEEEPSQTPKEKSAGELLREAQEYNRESREKAKAEHWTCTACKADNEGYRKMCRHCAALRKEKTIQVRPSRTQQESTSSAGDPPHAVQRKERLPRVGPALQEKPASVEVPSEDEEHPIEQEFTSKEDFLSLCSQSSIDGGTWHKEFHPRTMVTGPTLD